jgi:hypothetical protein
LKREDGGMEEGGREDGGMEEGGREDVGMEEGEWRNGSWGGKE